MSGSKRGKSSQRLGGWVKGFVSEALGVVREAVDPFAEHLAPQVSPSEMEGLSLADATDELPAPIREAFGLLALIGDGRQIECWQELWRQLDAATQRFLQGRRSAIAITGSTGSGRHVFVESLLSLLVERPQEKAEPEEILIHNLELETICAKERDFLSRLSKCLELEGEPTSAGVKRQLLNGPRRVILLERGHNLYIRKIGGFRALREWLALLGATLDRVLWVVEFDAFAWRYLDQIFQVGSYFDLVGSVPPLDVHDLKKAFERQMAGLSDIAVRFLPPQGLGPSERQAWREEAFYERLHRASHGNPHAAGILFRQSTRWIEQLKTAFIVPPPLYPFEPVLAGFSKPALLALALILEHEKLSRGQLADQLLLSPGETQAMMDGLERYKVVNRLAGSRYTVSPVWLSAVGQNLRSWNIL